MKIVLLDYRNIKVIYLDVEDKMIDCGVSKWLNKNGYDTSHYEWLAVKSTANDYIPIDFHRYAIHKGDGKEVHETCAERLRFASPFYREQDLKRRELKECIAALKKNGELVDGGYETHFDGDKPIVAGYLYDEPCDIVVNAVRMKDDDVYIIGYDKHDPATEQEISVDDLFAGQLNEITERI